MFSQQYNYVKKLLLLTFILSLSSCNDYLIGNMYAVSQTNGKMINMNYTILHGKVTISGKSLQGEYLYGTLLTPKQMRDMNISNLITLPESGTANYDYSFVRLVSKKSAEMLDCFILQNSKRRFYKGGYGLCYDNNGARYDLQVERTSYFSNPGS